jgi:hypothetical protein
MPRRRPGIGRRRRKHHARLKQAVSAGARVRTIDYGNSARRTLSCNIRGRYNIFVATLDATCRGEGTVAVRLPSRAPGVARCGSTMDEHGAAVTTIAIVSSDRTIAAHGRVIRKRREFAEGRRVLSTSEVAARLEWSARTMRAKVASGFFVAGHEFFQPAGCRPKWLWSGVVARIEGPTADDSESEIRLARPGGRKLLERSRRRLFGRVTRSNGCIDRRPLVVAERCDRRPRDPREAPRRVGWEAPRDARRALLWHAI